MAALLPSLLGASAACVFGPESDDKAPPTGRRRKNVNYLYPDPDGDSDTDWEFDGEG